MPRRNYIQMRFSDVELASYQALADKANLPLAVWLRDTLNYIVHREEQKRERENEIRVKPRLKEREFWKCL